MYTSRDKGKRSQESVHSQSLHAASSPCTHHILAAQSVWGCGWGHCHPSLFCHIKSNTQSIFLTMFCRPTVHELFLILFWVFLDLIVQFPGSSIIESIYTNSNICPWPRRRERRREGGMGSGGSSGRETLEEHWPWVACWETSGWSPVCSKEWHMQNFMSSSKDCQRPFRHHVMPLSCSDLRP